MTMKAVLFDLDDTLYGDFETCDRLGLEAAGEYAAKHIGIDARKASAAMRTGRLMLRDTLRDEPESHDRTLFAKLGLESIGINPILHAEAMHEAYWGAVIHAMERREGVTELLTTLKNAGISVGICTNMMADIQMRKLRHLGLADICGTLTSSEEAGKDKPQPAIFELAMKRLNVPADQTIMVGDNFQHDVFGAHSVNMQAIWLNIKHKPIPTADFDFLVAEDFPSAAKLILQQCGFDQA